MEQTVLEMTVTARHTRVDTALGELLLVGDGEALTGVYFPGHWHPPVVGSIGRPVAPDADPVLARAAAELREFLAGDRTAFDVPIRASGDEFQRRVWGLLAEIPYGETTTYGELAERLGDRSWARLVGQAVGRNPISVIVPCHRVVGAGGSLTGYAGGLERKQTLLRLEEPPAAQTDRLF